MGAWGAGNLENDDALDFVGELTSGAIEQRVRDALAAVHLVDDAEVDATVAAQALVAAELVAASRGHLADDFPADTVSLTKGLKAADLKDLACDAVSRVLFSSELVELWAEADESEEWNRTISGLIERLGKKPRKNVTTKKPKSKFTVCECSFCLEQNLRRRACGYDVADAAHARHDGTHDIRTRGAPQRPSASQPHSAVVAARP